MKRILRVKNYTMKWLETLKCKAVSKSGQGTTEYAILVGVLVVIAIIAIVAFKPSLQALWDAIQEGMSSLSA